MAGPGIRAWEIARALSQQGVDVTLATPSLGNRSGASIQLREFSWDDPKSLLDLINDVQVVLSAGPLLARIIHFIGGPITKPTIADIYDVAEIERIILQSPITPRHPDATAAIIDEMFTYLRQGDYFICASEQQLDYWMGALMAAGRVNLHTLDSTLSLDYLISVVPFGLSNTPPKPSSPVMKGAIPGIDPQDKVIFWGGGIWEWTDPLGLMEAFKLLLRDRDDLRIVFGARHHFENSLDSNMPVTAQLMDYVVREGWLDKYVFFLDWIPYDQIGNYLLEADLGVSLFKQSIENRFAIRSRLFDYLWAECPCVVTDGDYMSQFLGKIGLAQVIAPGETAGIASAILNSLERPRKETRIPRKFAAQIKQMYWSSTVQPILTFLREPRFAPDGEIARRNLHNIAPLRRDWNDIRTERDHLRLQLERFSVERIQEQDVFQRERDRFQRDLEANLAEINTLQLDNKNCQEAQENCLRALEEAHKEYEALQTEHKSARLENTELSHEYEKLQGESEKLQQECEILKTELKAYQNRRSVRIADYLSRLIRRYR